MVWVVFSTRIVYGYRKVKSYAYLPNLAGNQMGQTYDGLSVKFPTSEDKIKFCLICSSMIRTLFQRKVIFETFNCAKWQGLFVDTKKYSGLRTHAIEHS